MTDWTAIAKKMAPHAPAANIETVMPLIEQAMCDVQLDDEQMMLVAIATVHVETGRFEPISEGVSKFNTWKNKFDLYDAGTKIGRGLGNTVPGDGARYCGRGYIQITGRANYRDIGACIGVDLEGTPDLANDHTIAARILAAFLKRAEPQMRQALDNGDLAWARRLVNGGRHGLTEFIAAYERGENALASRPGRRDAGVRGDQL